MGCRFRVKEACLDEELHTLESIDEFVRFVLCYPPNYCREDVLHYRVDALTKTGVKGLFSFGGTELHKHKVLGKGYSSIAVLALYDSSIAVAKIRRLDSRRSTLEREAVILEYIEPYRVSPRIYCWSRDYVILEYIKGYSLVKAVEESIEDNEINIARLVLAKALVKASILDQIGIDHGELNRPGEHVLYNGDIYFIDFESASNIRKPRNLTSLASYFLIRWRYRDKILCRNYSRKNIISRLQLYKRSPSLGTARNVVELVYC